MSEDEILLDAADRIADVCASSHFHNLGLLNDQVSPEAWSDYTWKVRNAILDTAAKFQD